MLYFHHLMASSMTLQRIKTKVPWILLFCLITTHLHGLNREWLDFLTPPLGGIKQNPASDEIEELDVIKENSRERVKSILFLESSPYWYILNEGVVMVLGEVYTEFVKRERHPNLAFLESAFDDLSLLGNRAKALERVDLERVYVEEVNHGQDPPLAFWESAFQNAYHWQVRRDAGIVLGGVYAALVNRGKNPSLTLLESTFQHSNDWVMQQAAVTALGRVYAAQVSRGGDPSLSLLESALGNSTWKIRQAVVTAFGEVYVAQINRGENPSLSLLESTLKDDSYDILSRQGVATALGRVYVAKVNRGENPPLTLLESALHHSDKWVRPAAGMALAEVYVAQVNRGEDPPATILESALHDSDWHVAEVAAEALGEAYVMLVNQGKNPSLTILEAVAHGSTIPKDYGVLVRLSAREALENVETALKNYGKHPALVILESALHHFDPDVREAAKSLKEHYLELIANHAPIAEEDYQKYILWHQSQLSYQAELIDEYLASDDPERFISSLRREAERVIEQGFDPNREKELTLAFMGVRSKGIHIDWKRFRERLSDLARFDQGHPGHFSRLFTKTEQSRSIEVSSKESRQLDTQEVDASVFDRNLEELLAIREKIDSLSWFSELFGKSKVFNLRNFYFELRRRQAVQSKEIKEGERFHVKFPSEETMHRELLEQRRLFYQVVFGLAQRRLGDREIGGICLKLMRDLIVSDILSDQTLLDHMRSSDLETRLAVFKNFYENYKHHLPNSVGLKVSNIKRLSELFEELSRQVYAELLKVRIIKTKERGNYRLVPEGFLSIFRGRVGIVDCSFDQGGGAPYTRAMHEDTEYFFVYKGEQWKGYVGLLMGKTIEGEKVLTIDTIQSPSLDGEELLMNLFRELEILARKEGAIGIALPKDMNPSFNFDNKDTIAKMSVYQRGTSIRVAPVHEESWGYFVEMFGKDTYNSIEAGDFILLDLGTDLSAKKSLIEISL